MVKTTLKVNGMMCQMCEKHVNEAIKAAFNVDYVKSSHENNETVVISNEPLNENKVKEVIEASGYEFAGISGE